MGIPVLNIIDLVRQAIVIAAKAISTRTARIIARGAICGVVVAVIYTWFVGFNIPVIQFDFVQDLQSIISWDNTSILDVICYCFNIGFIVDIVNFIIRFLEGTVILLASLTVTIMLSFWVENLKNAAAQDVMDTAK